MKVSFIVTSYNEKDYLEECVNSIMSMNLEYSKEIIIVDDGSDDGSIDLIKELASKNNQIKYFVMDRTGVTKDNLILVLRATNVIRKGISLATGEYILLINGDDYYIDNDYLNESIKYLDENKEYISMAHSAFGLHSKKKHFKYNSSLFWANEYIHMCNYVTRNSDALKNNLLKDIFDDTGYFYSILCAGDVVYTNREVFKYRMREGSITHVSDELELALVEAILYQDIINNGDKFSSSSKARFCKFFKTILKNKEKLKDPKYKKYLAYFNSFDNNVLNKYLQNGISVYNIYRIQFDLAYIFFRALKRVYEFLYN